MSGEDLRYAATQGLSKDLRQNLQRRANSCSTDEYGLSPLHYASWNGHVECVKLLISNDLGVDCNGKRVSSVNLISCLGLTALHLAAMDCPTKHVKEIITLLLIAGSDQSLKSNSGKTAEEIARENNNEEALAGFFEYEEASDKTEIMSKFQDIAKDLHENYCYQDPSAYMTDVQPWDAKFHVPSFLFERQRAGLIPQGMKIHEHQIRPLIKEAVDEMAGPDALACLDFTRKQANMNKVRREILIQQSQPTWTPPILPKI